jgi:hypothetical protein
MTAKEMRAAVGRLREHLRLALEARVRGAENDYNAWVLFIHTDIEVDGPRLFRTYDQAIGRLRQNVPEEVWARVGRVEGDRLVKYPGRFEEWPEIRDRMGPDEPILHAGVRYYQLVEEAQPFLADVTQADAWLRSEEPKPDQN